MKSSNKIKVQALLLTAGLLAAYCGILVILELLPRPRAAAKARCVARANHARGGALPNAAQQHWHRVWSCPLGASLAGAPAAWSNGWIVATEKGCVVALDNRGQMRWSQTFSNAIFVGSPVVAGTNVVVLERNGYVTALQVASGERLWQVTVAGAFGHGPLSCGERGPLVVLSSADGVLHALDLQDGHELWQSEPTNRTDGPPGSDGQIIAYGNCDAALHIFNATNGEHLAQIPVGDEAQMAGGVLVQDGRIYGGTRAGSLICVDVSSNHVSWQVQVADSEAFNTPVSAHDLVIMTSHDGRIAAFTARGGAAQWQVSLSNVVKSLCVVDDAVFAVAGGTLVGLRTNDGGRFMAIPIGDDVDGPVWNGRMLVVVADGGNVIGIRGE